MSYMSNSQFCKNKNVVVRRRLGETKLNKRTAKNFTTYTNTASQDTESLTINCIEIITNDEDTESGLVSIEEVADRFREGIIVFDFGQIHVYLNVSSDLITDIDNTTHDDFSRLHDVYAQYKTFLLYRNKTGKLMILPKRRFIHSPFQRLEKEIRKNVNVQSSVCILMNDCYKAKHNNEREKRIKNKNNVKNEVIYSKNKFNKRNANSNLREISLELSKETTKSRSKKTITQAIPPLEKLWIAFPYDELLNLPVQVSEDQRDDGQIHSEQAISGVNSRLYSHVASPADIVETAHDRPRILSRYPNYSVYDDRWRSFSAWPHSSPTPRSLSYAGFFFTKNGDLVRCFQCGIGLKDFSPDDEPLLEHVRHSGQCPFLPELLGEEGLSMYKRHLQATDPEYSRQHQWRERHNTSVSNTSYHHPEYQTRQARISSFARWPAQMMQTPEQLADAGLFYTGFEDHVRCFACDGGLRRWDPDDVPWIEHCRWFPACPFAIEQKGEQFIALVQASVENEIDEASGGGMQDLPGEMERLKLRDSEIERIITQYRDVCLEMGYKQEDLKEAVQELRERGNEKPSLDDIIVSIGVIRDRKQSDELINSRFDESPVEENQRLKSFVFCMSCGKNNVNALFLPCTHHKLCMSCAESIDDCPVCNRQIREKIRTFMV